MNEINNVVDYMQISIKCDTLKNVALDFFFVCLSRSTPNTSFQFRCEENMNNLLPELRLIHSWRSIDEVRFKFFLAKKCYC